MSDHDVLFAISSSSASNTSTAATAATTTTTASSSSSHKSHHHKHHHHHHHKYHKNMAPTPDNDQGSNGGSSTNPNKAPSDKAAKGNRGEAPKDEKVSVPQTVTDLNDGELRALLDEAANYKNPKDREGKSKLFNHLLLEAEETERNARASRAGGSELVRYHNPSAARRGTRHRNKKRSCVSETMMHGGSLDNLAKETLYETSKSRGGKKSVSARQREGGSLPCNVNAPNAIKVECVEFLEEEARRRKIRSEQTQQQQAAAAAVAALPIKSDYSYRSGASYVMNMEPECFTYLNSHDVVAADSKLLNSINHQHQHHQFASTTMPIEIVHYPVAQHAKFTSMASLHVILPVSPDGGGVGGGGGGTPRNNNNVDDPIQLGALELSTRTKQSPSNNNNSATLEEIEEHKKVDENDNEKDNKEGDAGEEGKDAKDEADKKKDKDKEKKKKTGERNVKVLTSEQMKGWHLEVASSSVQSILKFVGEPSDIPDKDLRVNPPFKSSKLRSYEDNSAIGKKGSKYVKKRNKDHTNSSAGDKLKKSNSMGEISTAAFDDDDDDDDDVESGLLRNKSADRQRRSWGEMETQIPSLIKQQQNSSAENMEKTEETAENLETAEFQTVVTKKKKSRKRRSSLGTPSGVDPSGAHSSGGSVHHHRHHHHHHHGHQRDYPGRKTSEDGHSYSQSGSSYATSSVSESGIGLKSSNKPTAARSAPQSDKSDSCSDADSVHSLPISAVAHAISKTATTAAAGADVSPEAATKAKVLSYADMARNGDASCRTKQQQRTSFGTKIMTNYAAASGGGGNGVVDNNANNISNPDNINNNNSFNKVQPKVERRKSPEPDENEEEKQQQQLAEEKQEPPDVTSIKSFPAIKSPLEKNHGQSSVSNFSNNSSSSSNNSSKGKTQKIDASTNTGQMNAWNNNNNRGIAVFTATTPNSSAEGGLAGFENVSGNYAMYNKLPLDIPDVQTIEKMQLLSQGHPYEESISTISSSTANNTPIPSITSNTTGSPIITSTPKTSPKDCSLDCDISEKRTLNRNKNTFNNNRNKVGITAVAAGNIDASPVRDDGSGGHYEDRNLIINESGLEEYEIEEDDETEGEIIQQEQQRPPVVIFSGGEAKEVSGLVFGFDINEQLLNEGYSLTVEEFSSRFVIPRNYTRTSHNHSDIAKFVSDGWKNFSASNNVEEYSPDKL